MYIKSNSDFHMKENPFQDRKVLDNFIKFPVKGGIPDGITGDSVSLFLPIHEQNGHFVHDENKNRSYNPRILGNNWKISPITL